MGREHREPLPLFGRATHLEYLRERVTQPGLTAIVGRPKQGKSYLLRELRKQLARDGVLTGYFEANKTQTDTVLYAISDLYERWLTDSSWRQQAKSLYERHKADFTGVAAGVVDILLEAAKNLKVPLAGTVRKVFEKLLRADRDQKTGGLDLPPLTADQAMKVLQLLHAITDKPVVLIFDAWERTGRVTEDTQFLESFLDHWRDWPPMHVLVACREHTDEGEDFAPPRRLAAHIRAQRWKLPPMELDEGSDARRDLLTYLHASIPCTREIPDSHIIDLIGGYPGVLKVWFDSPTVPQAEELVELASGAQQLRHDRLLNVDLPALLDGGAAGELFRLLARLAMVPELSAEVWQQLKPVVLADFPDGDRLLDQLASRGLLVSDPTHEHPDVPHFGHTTEYDAARGWFLRDSRAVPHTRSEAKPFLLRLASTIRSVDEQDFLCALALAEFGLIVGTLGLDLPFQAFCAAARRLLGARDDETRDQLLASVKPAAALSPTPRFLLSRALFNLFSDARKENDLPLRDALLDTLRHLYQAYDDDPAVRETLARALYHTLHCATEENCLARRDALLDELRDLYRAHGDDPTVPEWIAKGLYNLCYHAKEENDLPRRDALLAELCDFRQAHRDDPVVREWTATGLFNTIWHATEENDLPRRDALLDELRGIYQAHGDDPAVRERFASALWNTGLHAKEEGNQLRHIELLQELTTMISAHPEVEAYLREELGI